MMSTISEPPLRIAKLIARSGMCSRREAERWIEQKRVSVDGEVIDSPAVKVTPAQEVMVDGEPLKAPERTQMWMFHKPAGCLTTRKDPRGRPTVYDHFPKEMQNIITIGRLDYNTEGLLLLTNDGHLARKLELPKNGWKRRYRVRVYGVLDQKRIQKLEKGMTVDGIRYAPCEITIEREGSHNHWLRITLTEGKNREIRKLMEAVELEVSRLIRVSYGAFQLGKLPVGELKKVPNKMLKEQVGTTI